MRAQNWLREDLPYRRDAFSKGLRAVGYKVVEAIPNPQPDDVFVCWNRSSRFDQECRRFEAQSARAVIVENGYLGKNWLGGVWFSMAIGHHAGAGYWPVGSSKRWDGWGVRLEPWRGDIGECVILGQRSIGESGIASPERWAETTQAEYHGRIRQHPAKDGTAMSLEHDLRNAALCLTWGSSAALHALRWGIPVYHELGAWIGAQAALPLSQFHARNPKRDDADRLFMFRRLAWSIWTLDEVESGAAFEHLLHAT